MLDAWPIFFISILISVISTSSGIGSAIFFSPLFFAVYNIRPEIAFALSLFIEIFGFGSGLISYFKDKLIDFNLAFRVLTYVIPGVLIGSYVIQFLPDESLEFAFAILIFFIGALLLFEVKNVRRKKIDCIERHVEWKKGIITYYEPKNMSTIYSLSALGGILVGFFSSGIGEIDEYIYLTKLKMHAALAAGTSLLVVAIAAITGSIIKIGVILNYPELLRQTIPLALFAIPGVIIGGRLGIRVSESISNPSLMRKLVGSILFFIALVLLFTTQPL